MRMGAHPPFLNYSVICVLVQESPERCRGEAVTACIVLNESYLGGARWAL